MNIRANKNGITLIALIITIVVLLILAGTAITVIEDYEIIARTEKAVFVSEIEKLKEKIQLSNYSKVIENNIEGNSNKPDYASFVPESLSDYIEVSDDGQILFKGDINSPQSSWATEMGIIEKGEYTLKTTLEELVDLAKAYIEESSSSTNSNELVLQYIRRNKYKGGNWNTLAGSVDTNFVQYVESNKSKSLDISSITDPNTGETIDFVHGMASLNVYLHESDKILAQYSCWAGDLCTLTTEVYNYKKSGTYTEAQLKTYTQGLLCGNSTFSLEDMLADADAVNIWQLIKNGGDLDDVIYSYYYGNGATNCLNRYNKFGSYLQNLYSNNSNSKNGIYNSAQYYLGVSGGLLSYGRIYASRLISNYSSIPDVVFKTVSTCFAEYISERM